MSNGSNEFNQFDSKEDEFKSDRKLSNENEMENADSPRTRRSPTLSSPNKYNISTPKSG